MLRVMSSRPVAAVGTVTNLISRLTATRFGVGRHLDPVSKRAFRAPFRDPAHRRRFHRLLRSPLEATEFLERIEHASATMLKRQPVLTIFGERNDPFGFQARHHATFPDHEGLVIEDGNHFPMADDPDLFAATVRDWWQRRVR
jgi:pimeloyl-ACP methyl ester carboxylesterase